MHPGEVDIRSHYRWKGGVNHDREHLLLIKTRSALFERVQQCIAANHDYAVPEIIRLPVTGGWPPYLDWIRSETAPP